MPQDAASLQNLRDIVVPEPPPLWPPAPGVIVLVVIALAAAIALLLMWHRSRVRNAYRRAGLALLETARTTGELNVVLKRVALAAWPRTEVASLYGDQWAAFLDGSCSRARFSSLDAAEGDAEPSPRLQRLARAWIRHHRVRAGSRSGGA